MTIVKCNETALADSEVQRVRCKRTVWYIESAVPVVDTRTHIRSTSQFTVASAKFVLQAECLGRYVQCVSEVQVQVQSGVRRVDVAVVATCERDPNTRGSIIYHQNPPCNRTHTIVGRHACENQPLAN
jgi:hypothetical protein